MKPRDAFDLIDKFIFNSRSSENVHVKSLIGALAIRSDGAVIRSINGSVRNSYGTSNSKGTKPSIKSARYHAEGRLLKKIDSGSIMYVARRNRLSGDRVMSRPCKLCQGLLRSYRVKQVYYTISEEYYGIYYPSTDSDKIMRM